MARPPTDGPTSAELAVLSVLWERGPSTVLQVRRNLDDSSMADSSVLKIMQIMVEKGLLARDESKRPQVYRPAQKKEQIQRHLLNSMVRKAFDGSPSKLVAKLFSGLKLNDAERQKLRELTSRK